MGYGAYTVRPHPFASRLKGLLSRPAIFQIAVLIKSRRWGGMLLLFYGSRRYMLKCGAEHMCTDYSKSQLCSSAILQLVSIRIVNPHHFSMNGGQCLSAFSAAKMACNCEQLAGKPNGFILKTNAGTLYGNSIWLGKIFATYIHVVFEKRIETISLE